MNRLHISVHTDHASITNTASFGELLSVTPMSHVPGNGHDEHIRCQFRGACFEFTAAVFAEMLRRGPEALGHLPRRHLNGVDVSGSVAQIGGEE